MAVLTNAQFTTYKRALRRDKAVRAEINAAALDKAQWMAALQALEDGYESRQAAIKAEVDTAAGTTLSNPLAKALEDVWMAERSTR